MKLSSSVFENNGYIPAKYTCDGEDISPPLSIENIPSKAKALALIVDDPDASSGTWVHWIIFNIPVSATMIKENFPTRETLSDGTIQGRNDFRKIGYGGPCPPSGVHRYFFKLYALNQELEVVPGATKSQVESAMKKHIIEQTQLIGLYKRQVIN